MANAKIELTVGAVKFAGEGEEAWVSAQLDKFVATVPTLIQVAPAQNGPAATGSNGASGTGNASGKFTDTLAGYIKAKGAESNQNQRFLATADWLRQRGAPTLTTAAVSKALSDNQQKRLGNPADCLNKNVAKGFCEKTADGFYITPDGLKALGHPG